MVSKLAESPPRAGVGAQSEQRPFGAEATPHEHPHLLQHRAASKRRGDRCRRGARQSSGFSTDDADNLGEPSEIVCVAGVEGETVRRGDRRDHQIDDRTAAPPTRALRRSEDEAKRAGSAEIERERIEGCLGSLQALLAPSALIRISCRMRPGGQFGECECGDRAFNRQGCRIDPGKVDHHRGIDKAAVLDGRVSHAGVANRDVSRGLRRSGWSLPVPASWRSGATSRWTRICGAESAAAPQPVRRCG